LDGHKKSEKQIARAAVESFTCPGSKAACQPEMNFGERVNQRIALSVLKIVFIFCFTVSAVSAP